MENEYTNKDVIGYRIGRFVIDTCDILWGVVVFWWRNVPKLTTRDTTKSIAIFFLMPPCILTLVAFCFLFPWIPVTLVVAFFLFVQFLNSFISKDDDEDE